MTTPPPDFNKKISSEEHLVRHPACVHMYMDIVRFVHLTTALPLRLQRSSKGVRPNLYLVPVDATPQQQLSRSGLGLCVQCEGIPTYSSNFFS